MATTSSAISISNVQDSLYLAKTEQLECLLFHPTNPDLLAAITKQSVTIWDLKTRTEIHQDKKEYVGAASWNPNGN